MSAGRDQRLPEKFVITQELSIDTLARAEGAITALLETGVLNPHERSHILEVRDRIERAVTRQREAKQSVGGKGVA